MQEHLSTTRPLQAGYSPLILLGRLSNGNEADRGRLSHAVPHGSWNSQYGTALCGAKPGPRSVGWSEYAAAAVTCPKCLKKIAQFKAAV